MQTTRYKPIGRAHRKSAFRGPRVSAVWRRGRPARRQFCELDRSSAHGTLRGVEPVHVTLSGDLSGDYVVEDRRPDGRVVLRPDLSVRAMLARHGERKLTPEEFEQNFGRLPTDGEG